MTPLVWHNEKRKVKDLLPFEHNPRILTETQAKLLKKSLEEFNLVEVPAINTNNMIVAGHQRVKILSVLGRGEEEIDVRVPNRALTDEEFRKYNVKSNLPAGVWDWEMLANNFDAESLLDWGFKPEDLGGHDGTTPGAGAPVVAPMVKVKLQLIEIPEGVELTPKTAEVPMEAWCSLLKESGVEFTIQKT